MPFFEKEKRKKARKKLTENKKERNRQKMTHLVFVVCF